jgi:outer membrane protein assembly factor BamB
LVQGSTVYLGTSAGQLVAADPANGVPLWSVATEEGRGGIAAVYGSPVTDGTLIYFGGYDGTLYAVDPARPEAERVVWRCAADRPSEDGPPSPFVGGPALAGDMVLIGSEDGLLFSIDKAQPYGATDSCRRMARWTFAADGHIWDSPTVDGDVVYIGTLDGALHAVRIRDDVASGKLAGQETWRFDAGAGIADSVTVADGVVYVGAFDNKLYALDAANGQPRWPQPFQAENWFWATPLLHQGRLYAPSLDHNVYILDAATGAPVQDPVRTGGAVRGAPALINGDRILVANEEGETWWIDAATGSAQAGGKVPAPVYAPAAPADGGAYIYAQDRNLYRVTPTARQPVRVYPVES